MLERSSGQSPAEKRLLTRRGFLGIDRVKKGLLGLKDSFTEFTGRNKDRLIEFLGEGAAIFAIWHVAREGARDPILTYEVKSEQAVGDLQQFKEMVRETGECRGVFQPCNVQTTALYDKWESEFEESRTVTKERTYKDANGEEKTETYTVTEYYWDEPESLTSLGLDNRRISQWKSILDSLDSQFQRLDNKAPHAVDFSGGENSLYYVAKEVDVKKELTRNSILYGTVGLAFAFYEEILSAVDKYGMFQADKHVSRRTVLKLIAAGAMAWGLRKVQLKFVTQNNGILDRMKSYNAQVIEQMEVSDSDNFRSYFGFNLPTLRSHLVEINNVCSATCAVDYSGWWRQDKAEWERVKPEVSKMAEDSQRSLEKFDNKFPQDPSSPDKPVFLIPQALTTLTKYVRATDQIMSYARKEKGRVALNHWLNALGLAAGLATVATIGEYTFALTDKSILKHKK